MKKGDQALYRDWLKETRFSDDYHKVRELNSSAKSKSTNMKER